MITARYDWNLDFGWHEIACLGPGPFARCYSRMMADSLELRLQRMLAMWSLADVQEAAEAA